MKILDYIKGLGSSSFSSGDILAEIKNNEEKLERFTIPAIEKLSEIEKLKQTRNKDVIYYTGIFLRRANVSKRSLSETLNANLKNIKKNLAHLEKEYASTFKGASKISAEGLTTKRAAFLANIGMFDTFNEYTTSLIDVCARVYGAKILKENGSDLYVIDKHESRLLEKEMVNYISIFNHITMKPKEYEKYLGDMLDVEVNEQNEGYVEAAGVKELPVRSGFTGGLIFAGFGWIQELKAANYKRLKARKTALEYTLIDLENASEGKSNAATQKEIKYIRSRIQKLDYEIKDYEED
jgi:hypothetical protein